MHANDGLAARFLPQTSLSRLPQDRLMPIEINAGAIASLEPSGFYPTESAPNGTFVWARGQFRFNAVTGARFIRFNLGYLGTDGTIRLTQDGALIDQADLRNGWQSCALRLPSAGGNLVFEIDPVHLVEGDSRELGVMLRTIVFFDDEQRFSRIRATSHSAVLNDREFRRGATVLVSTPPHLRITTEVRCNIPETSQPCTYCAWDWAKDMERSSPAFTPASPDQLGDFYHHALTIGDCSIGEPTMNKGFDEILARFDDDGKTFSFTTNGQLMGERRRRELLGRDIDVYVSLDAATAEGFKRYRNDQFDRIIANVRDLCREKRDHRNLPNVFASFIAMRSNAHELADYLDLMKDVGVDMVKLRALYLDDNVAPVSINNGYRFDYAAEVLSMAELRALGETARALAAAKDIALYVEWDEFEAETPSKQDQPLCAEPWKTLYVLRRGLMPCCYATKPIATWEDQGNRPLDVFLRDTFNSAEYRHIRSELAAGRLAPYCRDTPSCPVYKRLADQGNAPGIAPPQYRAGVATD